MSVRRGGVAPRTENCSGSSKMTCYFKRPGEKPSPRQQESGLLDRGAVDQKLAAGGGFRGRVLGGHLLFK